MPWAVLDKGYYKPWKVRTVTIDNKNTADLRILYQKIKYRRKRNIKSKRAGRLAWLGHLPDKFTSGGAERPKP